jgi:hypothetical protein
LNSSQLLFFGHVAQERERARAAARQQKAAARAAKLAEQRALAGMVLGDDEDAEGDGEGGRPRIVIPYLYHLTCWCSDFPRWDLALAMLVISSLFSISHAGTVNASPPLLKGHTL